MKYADARPKIKSGDILAWTHKPLRNWYDFQVQLVRVFTKSEYTHVGVAYVDGDREFVLESVSSGIRMKLLSEEVPFFWLPCDIGWNDEVKKAAFSKFGQSYSKWEGILSVWLKLKPGGNNHWECAEYVNFILQQAGYETNIRNIPAEVVSWAQNTLDAPLYTVSQQ